MLAHAIVDPAGELLCRRLRALVERQKRALHFAQKENRPQFQAGLP